jgi:hypothetical protein
MKQPCVPMLACLLALWASAPAHAGPKEGAESAAAAASRVAVKVEKAVKHGVQVAASGVERGAKAAGQGVEKAARKVGLPTGPASAPPSPHAHGG